MRMGDWSLFCGVICVVAGVLSFSARADGVVLSDVIDRLVARLG